MSVPRVVNDIGRGDVFGRYIVWERLGAGGMGVVYNAIDPELERRVALKLFHLSEDNLRKATRIDGTPTCVDEHGTLGVGAQIMLLNEAKIAAKVDDPHVVSIFDAGIHQGRVFVAMEFIVGETLRARIKHGIPNQSMALNWLRQTLLGLAAVHRANLVHADFKPENTILGNDGRVRLLDFGLAQSAKLEVQAITRTSTSRDPKSTSESARLVGTLVYLAPELLNGNAVTVQSDLFAWGVFAYEMLCGFRPYRVNTATELRLAHAGRTWQTRSEFRRLPKWLQHIVQQALATDPAQRPENVSELLQAFDRGLGSRATALRMLGLSAATFVGLTGAVVLFSTTLNDSRCELPDHVLDQVWNPDRAARLVTTFEASGSPLAVEAGQRFDETLNTWRQTWGDVYLQTCRAHQVQEKRPAATAYDQQLDCLYSRLEQTNRIVALFDDADRQAVEKSFDALDRLDDPEKCLDQAQPDTRKLPENFEQRERVEALNREIDNIRALMVAGREKIASKQIVALEHQVNEVGWFPQQAEWVGLLARLQYGGWDYKHSYVNATRSYFMQRALGNDPRMYSALTEQRSSASYVVGTRAESEEFGRMIQAIAQRWHYDIADILPSIVHYGASLININQYAEAEQVFLFGLDQAAKAGLQEPLLLAGLYTNLSICEVGRNRPDIGEEHSRIAVRFLEKKYGPNHPAGARALYNLAYALNMLGRFVEALEVTHRGRTLLENRDGPWTPQAVPFYHYTLDAWIGLGQPQKALAEYPQVLPLYLKMFGIGHTRAQMMMADWIDATIDAGAFDLTRKLLADVPSTQAPSVGFDIFRLRMIGAKIWLALQQNDLVKAQLWADDLVEVSAGISQEPDLDLTSGSIETLRLALALARNDHAAIAASLALLGSDAPVFHKLTVSRGYVQQIRGYLRLGDWMAAHQALLRTRAWIEQAQDPQDARLPTLDALWALYWAERGDLQQAHQLMNRLPEDRTNIERQLIIDLQAKLKVGSDSLRADEHAMN